MSDLDRATHDSCVAGSVEAASQLLASLPDDPNDLAWPSQVWNEHLSSCETPRKCPHVYEIVLPEWWVAKLTRRMPWGTDFETSMAAAMRRVNKYRGDKHVSVEGAGFARDTVRDALPSAPQPVSETWVAGALAATGSLATWVHNQGEPLTRSHVFAETTRRRWLTGTDGPSHLSEYSRRNYRLRLDIMASVLLGSQRETISGRKPMPAADPLYPLTRQEETDLWVWSQGLRPITVRQRVQAVIVLGLGAGTRRRDLQWMRGADVSRDGNGVHVYIPQTSSSGKDPFPPRVTTVAEPWADRLWVLVESLESQDRYLTTPWADETPNLRAIDQTLWTTLNNETAAPPVDFSTDSLRNTWIVRHLEAGTPLGLLMVQGALKSLGTVQKLVAYAEAPAPVQAATWMRRGTLR